MAYFAAAVGNTCSRTSSLGELRSLTNIGTAPWSITTLVFSDVPEAMLVRAHAASNYNIKNHYTTIQNNIKIKTRRATTSSNPLYNYLPVAVGSHLLQETQQSEAQLQTGSLPLLADCVLPEIITRREIKNRIKIGKHTQFKITNSLCINLSYLPIERSLRNWVVASSWSAASFDQTPATIAGRLSNCRNMSCAKHNEM